MKITCTVNDTAIQARITHLTRNLGNLLPVMHEIGQKYERRVLDNFAAESAPDGTKWPRLSATTLMLGITRHKGIGKRGGLIKAGRTYITNKSALVESGRMRSRVHYQADSSSVRIGINGIVQAAIHQFGGMAGRGHKVKIPARPWLAMNQGNEMVLAPRDRVWILAALQHHLDVGKENRF